MAATGKETDFEERTVRSGEYFTDEYTLSVTEYRSGTETELIRIETTVL